MPGGRAIPYLKPVAEDEPALRTVYDANGLTPFVEALEHGIPFELAAKAAGWCPKAVRGWLAEAEKGSLKYRVLHRKVLYVQQSRIRRLVSNIDRGVRGWRGAAWLLERGYPHLFGDPSTLALKGLHEGQSQGSVAVLAMVAQVQVALGVVEAAPKDEAKVIDVEVSKDG